MKPRPKDNHFEVIGGILITVLLIALIYVIFMGGAK